jgi:hypothetical protein
MAKAVKAKPKAKTTAKPIAKPKAKPAKTGGYRERIEALIAELDANPRVQVTWAYVAPPASASTIAKVEKAYGRLDPSIKAFYQSCDGFALQWYDKSSPKFDAKKHKRNKGKPGGGHLAGDYNFAAGSADFLPIEETFVSASWKEILYFDWMTNSSKAKFAKKSYGELDLAQSIRVVDNFSMFNLAGFITIVDKANPPISIGDDHGACWTDSLLTSFPDYLETVIATYASIEARRAILLADNGHAKKPPELGRAHWIKAGLTLDKVLDKWQLSEDQG